MKEKNLGTIFENEVIQKSENVKYILYFKSHIIERKQI